MNLLFHVFCLLIVIVFHL